MTTQNRQSMLLYSGIWTIFTLVCVLSPTTAFTSTFAQNLIEASRGPYSEVDSSNVSVSCITAFTKLMTDPLKQSKVADAIGKPAAGIFEGNFAWIGRYDECMNISDTKYCTVQMILNGTTINPELLMPISWGVCAPQECSSEDVNNGIGQLTKLVDVSQYFHPSNVQSAVTICSADPPRPSDAGFICTVILCIVILLLVVFSALYDSASKVKCQKLSSPLLQLQDEVIIGRIQNDDDDDDVPLIGSSDAVISEDIIVHQLDKQNVIARFIHCFSLTRNLSKLLDAKQSDRSILFLNGIRVISMSWVILGHTFYFGSFGGPVDNGLTRISFTQRFGFQAISNGTYSVDSFFFLSGLLVAYPTLSKMAKTDGKIAWFWFYFHRFWRLTPVYMFTMLVYMYLTPYFGKGPFWQNGVSRVLCSKYWWTNLLYINNFYPECMEWTWYLANDMQFFIVSPIFLASLFMFPAIGMVILTCVLLASFIVTGSIIGVYDLLAFANIAKLFPTLNLSALNIFLLVYTKPYCRIAPYLVGIALGYAMYRIGNRKVKLNPIAGALGWVCSVVIAMSVIYSTYPQLEGDYRPSMAANIIYGSVSHFVWAVALAWVVFACNYGYGGWVNSFLSWSAWTILSRLTYTAYLVHPLVLLCFYFNFATAVHYSMILFSVYYAGCFCLSYTVAAIFSLAIEFPFANIEKLFKPSGVEQKKS